MLFMLVVRSQLQGTLSLVSFEFLRLTNQHRLGAYAAIVGMIGAFKNPQVNAFTCTSPLNLAAA